MLLDDRQHRGGSSNSSNSRSANTARYHYASVAAPEVAAAAAEEAKEEPWGISVSPSEAPAVRRSRKLAAVGVCMAFGVAVSSLGVKWENQQQQQLQEQQQGGAFGTNTYRGMFQQQVGDERADRGDAHTTS